MVSGDGNKQGKQEASRRFDWRALLPLLIIAAGLLAYYSSFGGVFLFDDRFHVIGEQRLERLWPLSDVLARRRPVVDYTIAINYALGGEDPWGYHAVNVGVHILAAITLFGIVRRTLRREPLWKRWGEAAPWFALAVGLIWVTHPLLTQGVTYVIQRAESMMGLFYLLTLYCAIRWYDSQRSVFWFVSALVCCALGMGSKAVMVTAPLVVLAYDRVFLSTSFAEIGRRRWQLYAGLAATWSVLWVCGVAPAVLNPANTDTYVGFGYTGFTPLEYLQSQFGVLLYYLRLSFWPYPLCFDYHWPAARSVGAVLPQAVVILLLSGGTVWALVRNPWLGFLGLWFFFILAPTSSFVPIKDPIFEHRIYLSLAAVVTLAVFLTHFVVQHVSLHLSLKAWARRSLVAVLVVCVTGALTYGTIQRNLIYHNEVGMWRDVWAKQPDSPRAAENLGTALLGAQEMEEAASMLEQAVEMNPRSVQAYNGLGFAQIALGELDQAVEAFREAVRLDPNFTKARKNFGKALRDRGDLDEALEQFAEVLRINPRDHDARLEFANTFMAKHKFDEAVEQYVYIVSENPGHASAWTNLGTAHLNRAQARAAEAHGPIDEATLEEAAEAFRAAIRLNPESTNAHNSLGIIHAMREDYDAAIESFRQSLLLDPSSAPAHYNLANCLVEKRDTEGALRHFVAAIRIRPNDPNTHYELGMLLSKHGRFTEAIQAFRRTLQLRPDHIPAQKALEAVLARERDASLD